MSNRTAEALTALETLMAEHAARAATPPAPPSPADILNRLQVLLAVALEIHGEVGELDYGEWSMVERAKVEADRLADALAAAEGGRP